LIVGWIAMSSPSRRLYELEAYRDYQGEISRRDGAIHLARRPETFGDRDNPRIAPEGPAN